MTLKQNDLQCLLEEVVVEGGYDAALLSDSDGLTLAAVEAGAFSDVMAAIASILQDAARQARQRLEMAHVNELSLVDDDRFRLVCRFFETDDGRPLNLALIVPPDQAYRRITNRAIRRIQTVWSN
jgi:hypothetical protein